MSNQFRSLIVTMPTAAIIIDSAGSHGIADVNFTARVDVCFCVLIVPALLRAKRTPFLPT